MQDGIPNGEAERLLGHPLITEILDELERSALEAIVNTDDEGRRDQNVWEVRSIRSLRGKLKSLASGGGFGGETAPPRRGAVA